MIDILQKYYDIVIDSYEEVNDGILFFIYDSKYYLYKSYLKENDVNSIFNKINNVKMNIPLHSFVFNKNNLIFSEGFVLFKLNSFVEDVSLSDIEYFLSQSIILFDYVKMDEFWFKKIDYLEYQLIELSNNKIINSSFDYFVGLAELLLLFYKENYILNDTNLCLSHKVFNSLSTLEFYNPLNLSVDCKYKDIISFIRNTNDYSLLNEYLNKIDYNEKIYFFVRMCFPFYYFETLSECLIDGDEEEMLKVVNGVDNYEKYLLFMEDLFNIHLFSWIKKE